MLLGLMCPSFDDNQDENIDGLPNEEVQRFYCFLKYTNK